MSNTPDTAVIRAAQLPGNLIVALCDEVDRLRAELAQVQAERDELAAGLVESSLMTIHGGGTYVETAEGRVFKHDGTALGIARAIREAVK